MSTLAYAALTTKREAAKPGSSATTSPPGVKGYLDALAALVPAEVLTLHGVILSYTTRTQPDQAGNAVTAITEHRVVRGPSPADLGPVGLFEDDYPGRRVRRLDHAATGDGIRCRLSSLRQCIEAASEAGKG